jgi:hypothetical protein
MPTRSEQDFLSRPRTVGLPLKAWRLCKALISSKASLGYHIYDHRSWTQSATEEIESGLFGMRNSIPRLTAGLSDS